MTQHPFDREPVVKIVSDGTSTDAPESHPEPPEQADDVPPSQCARAGDQATVVRSREGAVAAREDTATLREEAAGLREEAAGLREETSTLGEQAVRAREEAADLREETSTHGEEAVRARERAAGLREETATLGEEAVRAREEAADLREETSALGAEAARAREKAAGLREGTSTLSDHAVHAREKALDVRIEVERLMSEMRGANERLLLSTFHAQMLADDREQAILQDEFFATLSHELRTPLNAVLGWATMLGGNQLPLSRARHAIAAIERNARALAHSLEDLLDVSRIGAGTLRLAQQPCDLVAVIQGALDAVRPFAVTKKVHLTLTPDQLVIDSVRGDPARLQQVLWNLLANGIKFTPEEGRVGVFVEPSADHVAIHVVDTGEGISPDFLPHVFEPFRQADGTTTRRHGGLGLGLALVRQLVQLHGGTVEAASQGEGHGATFTVRLVMSSEPDLVRMAS
jgi:signal transduction histidine kinase